LSYALCLFFLYAHGSPPVLPSFPTRRSSDLRCRRFRRRGAAPARRRSAVGAAGGERPRQRATAFLGRGRARDRARTVPRLNRLRSEERRVGKGGGDGWRTGES